MKSEVTFEHPTLFATFKGSETRSEHFNSKDFIQFTEKSGINLFRFEGKKLFFYSTNDDYEPLFYSNSHYVQLIAAPFYAESPLCFVVQNNAVFRIEVLDKKLHETNIHISSSKIISLHANDKYLYIGTDSNHLTRINIQKNDIKKNFFNDKALAIASFDNFIGIISYKYQLIIIDQNTLKILNKIPLEFIIHDDVQIKIRKIDGDYSAAILSNSKIHIISFKIDSSELTNKISIPAESAISFDIHNNSIIVIRKINCNYNDFSCRASRIYVYPHFSSEPQYEWDITKELDFIYQINIQPSKRSQIINDKLRHISHVFGCIQNPEDCIDPTIIRSSSPRQIIVDQNENLWIVSQNSLLCGVSITEEIASFRGMLNYIPEEENNAKSNQESKKQKPSTIAQLVNNQITTFMQSEIDFTVVHNLNQIIEFVYQKSEDFYEDNNEFSENIAEKFKNSFFIIKKYINEFKNKIQDLKNQYIKNSNQSLNAYINDFWGSVLISQSYQIMKYFISLLMASYLFKKLKLFENKRIHNEYCLLNSLIEENVCSFASVYKFSLSNQIKLNLKPLSIDYELFQNSLSKQFYNIFYSTDFLIDFLIDFVEQINTKIETLSKKYKPELIKLIEDAHNYAKENPSEKENVLFVSEKFKKIISIINNQEIKVKKSEETDTNKKSLKDKIVSILSINEQIDEIDRTGYTFDEINDLQNTINGINEIYNGFDDILHYSSNMTKPDHLLVISMIHLINGDIDRFFKYFRRFKFFDFKYPQILHEKFYNFVLQSTDKSDPQTYVSFVNEDYENLMVGIDIREDTEEEKKIRKQEIKEIRKHLQEQQVLHDIKEIRKQQQKLQQNENSNNDKKAEKDDDDDDDEIYNSKLSHFRPYFLNSIRIKDYDSAFNAFIGLSSAYEKARIKAEKVRKEVEKLRKLLEDRTKEKVEQHKKYYNEELEKVNKELVKANKKFDNDNMELEKISILQAKSLERLIKSMKENKCIAKFSGFPFGVHRLRILKLLSCGSPTSLFLAAAIYRNCGEYSKSGSVLVKYVHSVLCKREPTKSELRKAKSALILIAALMNNHDVYIRDSMTMCLFDIKNLNKLRANVEKLIIRRRETKLHADVEMKTIPRTNSSLRLTYLRKEYLPYSASEAAFFLNNTNDINIDVVQSHTEHFLSKPNVNQQIYKFIKKLKNKEALQLFLVLNFNFSFLATKMNIKFQSKIYGLWLHIIFARHNLQCLSGLVQSYIISENEAEKGQTINKPKQGITRSGLYKLKDKSSAVSQRRITQYIAPSYSLCSQLLTEIFLEKAYISKEKDAMLIRSICNFPISAEVTMKLFPLVQICYFKSLQKSHLHYSISSGFTITIEGEKQLCMIVCCPRGKVQVKIQKKSVDDELKAKGGISIKETKKEGGKENEAEDEEKSQIRKGQNEEENEIKNDDFLLIKNLASKTVEIMGLDDNTEIFIVKSNTLK